MSRSGEIPGKGEEDKQFGKPTIGPVDKDGNFINPPKYKSPDEQVPPGLRGMNLSQIQDAFLGTTPPEGLKGEPSGQLPSDSKMDEIFGTIFPDQEETNLNDETSEGGFFSKFFKKRGKHRGEF